MPRQFKDDLDDIVAERTARNPEFPQLLKAAAARRELMDALRQARIEAGLTQTEVAARMHTSASSIARLERVARNSTLQTVQEYANALGKSLTWSLDDRQPESATVRNNHSRTGDRQTARPVHYS